MASCYRSISRPGYNLLKSAFMKPCTRPVFPAQSMRSPSSLFSRSWSQMGALQSLLPLHSAISSARLTSYLGADSIGCRSLSQGGICLSSMGRPISYERAVAWKVLNDEEIKKMHTACA